MTSILCLILGVLDSIFCIGFGIIEVQEGTLDGTSIIMYSVLGLLALGLFYLAYHWWGETPVSDLFVSIGDYFSDTIYDYGELSPRMKRRFWIMRILGAVLFLYPFKMYLDEVLADDINYFMVTIATILLVAGITMWKMALPSSYNDLAPNVQMYLTGRGVTIDELYQVYKDVKTDLGSCYLGKVFTLSEICLIWGDGSYCDFLYLYLKKDGEMAYLASNSIPGNIEDHLTEPLFPAENASLADAVDAEHMADAGMLMVDLGSSLEDYFQKGIQPPKKL